MSLKKKKYINTLTYHLNQLCFSPHLTCQNPETLFKYIYEDSSSAVGVEMRKECKNLHTHFSDKKWGEIPILPISTKFSVKFQSMQAIGHRKHWKTLQVRIGWMYFKHDYRVGNGGGQVEQCSLTCKGRIRH